MQRICYAIGWNLLRGPSCTPKVAPVVKFIHAILSTFYCNLSAYNSIATKKLYLYVNFYEVVNSRFFASQKDDNKISQSSVSLIRTVPMQYTMCFAHIYLCFHTEKPMKRKKRIVGSTNRSVHCCGIWDEILGIRVGCFECLLLVIWRGSLVWGKRRCCRCFVSVVSFTIQGFVTLRNSSIYGSRIWYYLYIQ